MFQRSEVCIFCDNIFYINKVSYTGRIDNPLNYIETGTAGSVNVLSDKGCWYAMHWHCQDIVIKLNVQQEILVMKKKKHTR